MFPHCVGDDARSFALQAGFQVIGIAITLFIALAAGALTGEMGETVYKLHCIMCINIYISCSWKISQSYFQINFFIGFILNISKIFDPLNDYELFDDASFWSLPDDMGGEISLNKPATMEMTHM